MDELRIRLIARLCRLDEAYLPRLELFLNSLKDDAPASALTAIGAHSALGGPPHHKDWPHAPLHRLSEHGTFIVTASTLGKEHLFRGEERLTLLEDELLRLAKQYGVQPEAWVVFSNHFHLIAHTSGVENQLTTYLSHLHTSTAAEINRRDGTPGRQVWFNFRETELTFEKSYFARLNYVHHNAVKHGLVSVANQYRWCSAAWFERTATSAQVKTVYSFKYDRISVEDDFDPVM